MEGPQPIKADQLGPTPILPPLIELPHTLGAASRAATSIAARSFPSLSARTSLATGKPAACGPPASRETASKEMPEIARPSVRIVAFGEDNEGELYLPRPRRRHGAHASSATTRGTQNADFPTKLSQTGLFASVAEQEPAAGVVPFAINSRQWQDGATAEHWLALPGESSVTLHAKAKPIPGMVYWHNFRLHFPENAVLVKTISLAGKRLETQLLHFDGVDWQPYTYAWRDDQADADLVPAEGAEKEVSVGTQKLLWQFHSRSQCRSCHSSWSEYRPGVFSPSN